MNWAEFFAMGGYGFYVWFSYATFFIVLGLGLILPVLKRRSLETELREQWAVTQRRKRNQ